MSGSHFHAVFPFWLNNDFQFHQRHGFSQDRPGRLCTFKLPQILKFPPFTRPARDHHNRRCMPLCQAKKCSTAHNVYQPCLQVKKRLHGRPGKALGHGSKAMEPWQSSGLGMIWVMGINRIRPPALIMRAQGFADATGGP